MRIALVAACAALVFAGSASTASAHRHGGYSVGPFMRGYDNAAGAIVGASAGCWASQVIFGGCVVPGRAYYGLPAAVVPMQRVCHRQLMMGTYTGETSYGYICEPAVPVREAPQSSTPSSRICQGPSDTGCFKP